MGTDCSSPSWCFPVRLYFPKLLTTISIKTNLYRVKLSCSESLIHHRCLSLAMHIGDAFPACMTCFLQYLVPFLSASLLEPFCSPTPSSVVFKDPTQMLITNSEEAHETGHCKGFLVETVLRKLFTAAKAILAVPCHSTALSIPVAFRKPTENSGCSHRFFS